MTYCQKGREDCLDQCCGCVEDVPVTPGPGMKFIFVALIFCFGMAFGGMISSGYCLKEYGLIHPLKEDPKRPIILLEPRQ